MKQLLKELLEQHNLIEKSMKLFQETFDSYRKEELEEFEKIFKLFHEDKLNVYIHSIAFKIGYWTEYEKEYMVVQIRLMYENKSVGHHDVCFDMDGEMEDDYFVIY